MPANLFFELQHRKVFRHARGFVQFELGVQVIGGTRAANLADQLRHAAEVRALRPRTSSTGLRDPQMIVRLGSVTKENYGRVVSTFGAWCGNPVGSDQIG